MTWDVPPLNLQLSPSRVDVWRVHLDTSKIDWQTLSPDEQERGRKFVSAKHRHRFAAARFTLRYLLGLYCGVPPRSLEFSYGQKGKPSVENSQQKSDIRFNVSHSEELSLIAITSGREIGVDIETRPKVRDHMAIARRFFSEREYNGLCNLPDHLTQQAFLRCWTRKESYIKAIGEGLSCPLHSFSVSVSPELTSNALLQAPANFRFHVSDLAIPDPGFAALAVEAGPVSIACWTWAYS